MDFTLLQPLIDWLKAQGDVGYVIAALIPVVITLLYKKFGPQQPATTPLKETAPTLDLILKALGIVPKGKVAVAADLPHDVHLKLQSELDKVAEEKNQEIQKQRDDFVKLNLVDVPPAAK